MGKLSALRLKAFVSVAALNRGSAGLAQLQRRAAALFTQLVETQLMDLKVIISVITANLFPIFL